MEEIEFMPPTKQKSVNFRDFVTVKEYRRSLWTYRL